jgi:hypothetical protein
MKSLCLRRYPLHRATSKFASEGRKTVNPLPSRRASIILRAGILGLFFTTIGSALQAQGLDPSPSGDGVADDTAAIQQMIDRGGVIELATGRYRLTQTLEVDLDRTGYASIVANGTSTLVMTAPGPAIRFRGTHFQSADPETMQTNIWSRQRMPLIEGIAIEGAHIEADGIEAIGTVQLTITRTHVRRCRHAIRLTSNNRNLLIADCHLYENQGCGIFFDDVNLHQSNITGCHISYNAGGGIVSRGGNVRNIHITGCDIESNMSPESPPTANVLIDCSNSQYGTAEVAITGCTIQHNNPSPESANIRILGHSNAPANKNHVREGNITISGNVLSDVKINIHLRDCRGVAVTGNTLWQGYQHNLLFENCSNLVVSGNNLDRNPRYDYGNTADANNSVVIRRCEDCTISGLHVTNVWRDQAGILIEECRRFNISQLTILDCDKCGLWLKNVRDSLITGCLVRDDREGPPLGQSISVKTTNCENLRFGENLFQQSIVNAP